MKKLFFILFFISVYSMSFSQIAQVELDTNALLIGDQTNLQLKYSGEEFDIVKWPVFVDTITAGVDIVNQNPIDTIIDDGNLSLLQQLTITSFDTGYHIIQPIVFEYQRAGDTTINLTEADPLLLRVNTMEVDTTLAIRDIKGVMKAPITFKEALPYTISGLLILGLIILTYFLLSRRKKIIEEKEIEVLPQVIPHKWAIDELEKVRLQKLWQNEKIKEYYTITTDIIREYLEMKFDILALEQTTDEIMDDLKVKKINTQALDKLFQALNLADLVKFAKAKPLPLEHEMCLEHLIDFIQETKRINSDEKLVVKERRINE